MIATIRRFDIGKHATSGLLFLDGIYFCHCLENTAKKIKAGTYSLILSDSPKFSPKYGHPLIEVVVPGTNRLGDRDQILFHIGNDHKDSRGCILVGLESQTNPDGDNEIHSSRGAYDRLYPIVSGAIKDGEPVMLNVSDPDRLGIPDSVVRITGPADSIA